MTRVKSLLPFLVLLTLALSPAATFAQAPGATAAKKPYIVYAEFVTDSPVMLSNGAEWMMEKGDCFPVHMFKQQQTKVVLQLADSTFLTEAYRVRVLKDNETAHAKESYQKMVDSYLKAKARDSKASAGKKGGS